MRALKLSTAKNLVIFMVDSADHISGKAGLTLTITASKDGANALSSISPSVTDIGSGWYSLALTTTHTNTIGDLAIHITGTGADPTDVLAQVVAYDPTDAVRLGLTALPNAAAEASGGLYTRGNGAGQITQDANGRIDANTKAWAGTITTLSSGVPDVNVKTITAAIIAAGSFASGALDAVWATTTRAITDKAGFALSTGGVQAIWDALTSALTTAGSIGKALADNITGNAYTRLGSPAGASVSADIAAVKVDTAAVKLKTDLIPAAPAAVGDIPSAAANASALLGTDVETAVTLKQAMRLVLAALAGKVSGAATTTVTIRDVNDGKNRIIATVDADGNRTAFTYDVT